MLMAMSADIRVILVKLADRLHNMRTLHFFKDNNKKYKIAHETQEIYAPLAQRLGIKEWQDELEDYSFNFINKFSSRCWGNVATICSTLCRCI